MICVDVISYNVILKF